MPNSSEIEIARRMRKEERRHLYKTAMIYPKKMCKKELTETVGAVIKKFGEKEV